MNESNQRQFRITGLTISLIGIIVGLLFVLLSGEILANIVFIISGVLIIAFTLPAFIQSIKDLHYRTPVAYSQFAGALITIISGIILIFWHDALTWIISILILVFSLIRIIMAKSSWSEELIHQLPAIIFAIIILVIGIGGVLDILLDIIGYILLVLSSIYFVISLVALIRKK